MKRIKQLYHLFNSSLKGFVHSFHSKPDFRNTKLTLMSSADMSDYDKMLLEKVNLQVHHKDAMYKKGMASHYLSVGLSANNCIQEAIRHADNEFKVRTILDFPCGYGRVLRFLRSAFPNAEIVAAEINTTALKFCQKNFDVSTIVSDIDFNKINFQNQFDLIWCGSLFTHIDENTTSNLLKFFHDHLSEHGICVFTTHGAYSNDLLVNRRHTYGMTNDARQKVIDQFKTQGFGYTDYLNQTGYGISLVSKEKMLNIAEKVGNWELIWFKERGWDTHQDVYAFKKLN